MTAKPVGTQSKSSTSAECKKGDRLGKNLFIESEEETKEQNGEPDHTLEYEEAVNPELEELVTGDCDPLLVVCQANFTPKEMGGDAWLRNNIF